MLESTLRLGDIELDVVHKDIKNVHLSVYPPDGHVRVAAPSHMPMQTIRAFLLTKLGWIKREQRKFKEQPRREAPLLIDRESHYVWGDRYLLEVHEREAPPEVELSHNKLRLYLRPGSSFEKREEVLALWYRGLVRDAARELQPRWEAKIGASAHKLFVRHMKTKWGSCNPSQRTLRLNTELAKKRPACLEYILVHELIHLHEPTHNARFQELMDRHLPKWRELREELNRQPLSHESWTY